MKMLFKIFCVVLVLSVVQIGARPSDFDLIQNGVESEDDEVFGKIYKKYKIPHIITPHTFAMTINGTATDKNSKVTILVTDASSQDVCTIDIDIGNTLIKVSPPLREDDDDTMTINISESQEFSIKMSARVTNESGKQFFDVTYTGGYDAIPCQINDFSDISYIVVKGGIKNIQNMLFEFITKTETR